MAGRSRGGGNIEAARRAGIAVDRLRISVFVLALTLPALEGILATARLGSAPSSSPPATP